MCNCIAEWGPYVHCIAATTREHNPLGSCYHVATLPTHLFVCLILKPLFHAFKPRQTFHHQQQSLLESLPTDKTTNLSANTLRSITTTQAPSSSRQRRPSPRHIPSAPSAGSRNGAFHLGHLPDWPDESHNRHRRANPSFSSSTTTSRRNNPRATPPGHHKPPPQRKAQAREGQASPQAQDGTRRRLQRVGRELPRR
jgi:hypothetical protein